MSEAWVLPESEEVCRTSPSSILLANALEERRAGFAAVPGLDAALLKLVEEGRRAWPELHVPETAFLAFLGRCLRADGALDPASLRAADLYLACAYGLRVAGADAMIEARYIARVRQVLGRIGVDATTSADICQEMRGRLIEMSDPPPDRKTYEGRGDLVAWLCVSAVRAANRSRGRREREVPLDALGPAVLSTRNDPEMEYVQRTYKRELARAFQEALATLSSRDRNLLRYHFLDELTVDQIGVIYGVHRATAARWVHRARRTLCERTREGLSRKVSVSQASFQRLLGLIASQISVQLAAQQASDGP